MSPSLLQVIIYRINKRYPPKHILEAFHDLKENNVNVLINELQMLEMNSFTVLISIFKKKKNMRKNILYSYFWFFPYNTFISH